MSFPFYKQHDAMDCGPACLKIITSFYGMDFHISDIRKLCDVTKNGTSIIEINNAACKIGFKTAVVSLDLKKLISIDVLPCIAYWNSNHYVVLYKIRKRLSLAKKKPEYLYYVSDPSIGLLKYSEKEFKRFWCNQNLLNFQGVLLLLEPTSTLRNYHGTPIARFNYKLILKHIKPYKTYLVLVIWTMLLSSVFSLILPLFTQSLVDIGISEGNKGFVLTMLIAQVFLAFGQMINDFLRSWTNMHISTRLNLSLVSKFLSKLMRLPLSFIDKKHFGDIMQRIKDTNRIQYFLTDTIMSFIIAIISFCVYCVIITSYNIRILIAFVIGSLLYIFWVSSFLKMRKSLDYEYFHISASNQNNMLEIIGGLQEIKLNVCEKQKRWRWEQIQSQLYHISIKNLSLKQIQQIGSVFIEQSKKMIISFIAANSVITGEMTLGMMMALQYILGQLNAPVMQIMSFIQETQDAIISLERVNDIYSEDDETPDTLNRSSYIDKNSEIEIKRLFFKYSKKEPYVLNDLNLKIPANKVTAIVGGSGSGKTTILRLVLGLYQPTAGCIYLGEQNILSYNLAEWRKSCGVVMQNGYIFSETIADNISLGDENPDYEKIVESAKKAHIDEFIQRLPLKYETVIGSNGLGLSVGQKQRILIARAIYKDSKFLFLDEATNSLDANNEKFIMEDLYKLFKGKTVLIIAHRLSTVKRADNIVVLENGCIVEEGKHDDLILRQSYYYNLIKNQLELDK